MYSYHWLPGTLVPEDLISQFATLYSNHYGVWGRGATRPGERVKLTPDRARKWLTDDTYVVWATALGVVVGYAITMQSEIPKLGPVAWVTQLVVNREHRHRDVAKALLFSAWKFSDYFAWGLLSANPYAIRALEKATRRRCDPERIRENIHELKDLGEKRVHYVAADREIVVDNRESRIDSAFYLDLSELPEMLRSVDSEANPWRLGSLPEGWEWFAFTFRDQEQIGLSNAELEQMLRASDELTKAAYARMLLDSPEQKWATHTEEDVNFIISQFHSAQPNNILDFGCGMGRHSLELARRGFTTTAVDYVPEFIERARARARELDLLNVEFITDDCRSVQLRQVFDAAICLYDVVGSYATNLDNRSILENLAKHVRPEGLLLISVMSMELTERNAKNWFCLSTEPDKLLALQPSNTMEKTGNVFNPELYMIERDSKLVYRKEQFRSGTGLPEEFIIRDRRYSEPEIRSECTSAGLEVIWTRFVRSGRWYEELPSDNDHAKEILVLCRKPKNTNSQANLFSQ